MFDSRFAWLEFQPDQDAQWDCLLRCCVAGTGYVPNIQNCLESLGPNQPLSLQREPWNPYDSNAIVVLNAKGQKCGYIPRQCNRELAQRLDQGDAFELEFLWLEAAESGWPEICLAIYGYRLCAAHLPSGSGAILKAQPIKR